MKFTWLQDLPFPIVPGGAELTDWTHYLEGVRRGHDIQIITPEFMPEADTGRTAIVSNAMSFSPEFIGHFESRIFFVHDYANLCKFRLFYPMRESCKNCYRRESWLPVMLSSKLIIWLSPLHRKSWLWVCPELKAMPYALIPSPVSTRDFFDMGLKRNGVITVNSLLPFKDGDNIVKWAEGHPDKTISIVGENPGMELPPNCRLMGRVAYKDLNRVYNEHETFLHLPKTPQPFSRTCAEAYLAGCSIEGNALVGALSWKFFREGREATKKALATAPVSFWKEIEQCLK